MGEYCQKKVPAGLRRAVSFVLALVLALSLLGGMAGTAQASGGAVKEDVSRTIAIVFDNSGSMYMNGRKWWSQAIYSIEVFAAMMNQGDTLMVYPMHAITVGDKSYTMDDPLVIKNQADIPDIQKIYTPSAKGTPIETIYAAYDGLMAATSDEKWLIVLTDGAQFYENGRELSTSKTLTRLSEELSRCNEDVDVLYLGIGNMKVPEVSGKYSFFGTNAPNSADVLAELSGMCNRIFGRDQLPNVSTNLSFDIPISKLIVFAQGEDVEGVTLKDSSGREVGNVVSEYAPHYSTMGAGGNYAGICKTDESLQGVIVTYKNIPAGDYTLDCDGATPVVYYEPDVGLTVMLVDENGNQIKPDQECYAGTYYIRYGLVDNEDKITDSELLGNKNFTITYTLNGKQYVITDTKSGQVPVELEAGANISAHAKATYLSGYTIEKNGTALGWPPDGFGIAVRPAGVYDMTVSGGSNSYKLAQLEEEGIYHIDLLYENEVLTGEALNAADLQVSLEGGNVGYELQKGEDGYTLKLLHNGSALETDCGEYTVKFSGTYTNIDGQIAYLNAQNLSFTIEDEEEKLTMDVDVQQDFYRISQIGEGEPILVTLEKNGLPLTDEELAATTFTAEATGGLTLLVEPVPGESAYSVRVDPSSVNGTGVYELSFKASTPDQVGRELTAEDSGKIELQTYPRWLRTLIIALAIALIILLIWLYMNMKVLPKKIAVGKTIFTVDGMPITGSANCVYSGGGKKKGSLEINSPKYSTNPLVKCGFRLELEAISPRREKSASRAVRVVSVTPINTSAVESIKVGSAQFIKVSPGNKLVKAGGKPNAPIEFQISTGARCNVSGEVLSGDGGSTAISLAVILKYY